MVDLAQEEMIKCIIQFNIHISDYYKIGRRIYRLHIHVGRPSRHVSSAPCLGHMIRMKKVLYVDNEGLD